MSSSFPPIKGLSAAVLSLSHHRTENYSHRLPSYTEIDDYADVDNDISFSNDDLHWIGRTQRHAS